MSFRQSDPWGDIGVEVLALVWLARMLASMALSAVVVAVLFGDQPLDPVGWQRIAAIAFLAMWLRP